MRFYAGARLHTHARTHARTQVIEDHLGEAEMAKKVAAVRTHSIRARWLNPLGIREHRITLLWFPASDHEC